MLDQCENSLIYNFFGNKMYFFRDKEAIYDYDEGRRYTFGELGRRADSVGTYLREKLGLKAGDRIGICCCNREEFFDLFFAAYKNGFILTTYNGKLKDWELAKLIDNELPSVLFTGAGYYESVNAACRLLQQAQPVLADFDRDGGYGLVYQEMLAEKAAKTAYRPDAEDILMLIHTGGTTGLPKAAMLSYRAIVCNAISTSMTHSLTPEDSTYLMLPLFHTAAWNSVALAVLLIGGRIILKRKFNVDDAFDIIEKERPTFLLGVPTIYHSLLQSERFEKVDFSSIKALRCGAAPLSPALFQAYDEKGLQICNAYGLTECGPCNFSFPMRLITADILREKVGSVGMPMYFNRVRIVDDEGNELPAGCRGELQFSGCLVFSGYWNHPEETAKAKHGDWVATGDIAYCDEDGFYYIVGRKKRMFISGGENIYPVEIENVLMERTDIEDCAVIGIEDPRWGEVGLAYVQMKDGEPFDEEKLHAWLKDRFSTIKCPRHIVQTEKIPRNTTGKLLIGEVESMAKSWKEGIGQIYEQISE